MLTLLWTASAATRDYFHSHMPTNIVIDLLRTRRGWAIPVGLLATATCLFAMSVCALLIEHGGPGYLNVLVLLFFWDAMKFAWLTLLSPLHLLHPRYSGGHREHTENVLWSER